VDCRHCLHHLEFLADHFMAESIEMSKKPHSFCYDNMNLSSSIFVEQRGALGPAKVTSGTFGLFYLLQNARWEYMLIAPIMKRCAPPALTVWCREFVCSQWRQRKFRYTYSTTLFRSWNVRLASKRASDGFSGNLTQKKSRSEAKKFGVSDLNRLQTRADHCGRYTYSTTLFRS
jgi:hypothetical protein